MRLLLHSPSRMGELTVSMYYTRLSDTHLLAVLHSRGCLVFSHPVFCVIYLDFPYSYAYRSGHPGCMNCMSGVGGMVWVHGWPGAHHNSCNRSACRTRRPGRMN